MGDVYKEVDEIMTRLRVGIHKIKSASRKYAFETPEIPKEADYLKLMYPYDSESHIRVNPMTFLTGWFRAGLVDRPSRGNFLPRIRHQYSSLRAICSLEEYHGALLAQH